MRKDKNEKNIFPFPLFSFLFTNQPKFDNLPQRAKRDPRGFQLEVEENGRFFGVNTLWLSSQCILCEPRQSFGKEKLISAMKKKKKKKK